MQYFMVIFRNNKVCLNLFESQSLQRCLKLFSLNETLRLEAMEGPGANVAHYTQTIVSEITQLSGSAPQTGGVWPL